MNQKQTFRIYTSVIAVVILLSCSSCGQKGDLYLPAEKQAAATLLNDPA